MPLTPSATQAILRSIGHRPKKKLGQNFLVDGNIVKKSLSMSSMPVSRKVLEIGPGLGTLTEELLDRGHEVHAVEIDSGLAGWLRQRFALPLEKKQLFLSETDAVKHPIGRFMDSRSEFSVVANLPYAISSPWLEAVLGSPRIPVSMTLMLQKEAADRMCAKEGSKNYNALSIFLSGAYELTNSHPVSRQCFFPIPAVDSVLIQMNRVRQPSLVNERTRILIRSIFTKRRKQMGAIIKLEKSDCRDKLGHWLRDAELSQTLRPEQICPTDWLKLSQYCKD